MPKRKSQHEEAAGDRAKRSKQTRLNLSGQVAPEDTSLPESYVESFKVSLKDKEIPCERRGGNEKPALIFTHGAGGGLSNAATRDFAEGFAEKSPVVSFQGSMNLQGRVRSFQAILEHEGVHCAVGGRSMGARAAVLTAQQSNETITSLVLVSYPMIGAQKGDSREQILLDLPEGTDILFISGSNDSMCSMEQLRGVMDKMKARAWLLEVQSADHGMNLKPKAGIEPMVKRTGVIAAEWLIEHDEGKKYCSLSWSSTERKVVSTGWQSEPTKSK